MKRTTIMLPPELKTLALRRAKERGVSLGQLIRECLEEVLNSTSTKMADDPLFGDDAVYGGAVPADLASDHDSYLYDEIP